MKQQNKFDPQKEVQTNSEVRGAAFDTSIITQQMRKNEDSLLAKRSHVSTLLFTIILGILLVSFVLSACMFWLYYRLLNRELHERGSAEDQMRRLSLELMRVQDEEHKRFARELHDGLGQTLAGAKMMVDAMAHGNSRDPQIEEVSSLLGEALKQTRTVSYLFHPPFLEEIGFSAAAKWLVDGWEQHTGVAISADIPRAGDRLPRSLELTLYRVLQEALNNIHRHSQSAKADVSVKTDAECVILRVRDYGRGISSETLATFYADGTQAGVGLRSMKERVKEQSGELEIRSHTTGTEIVVKIPLNASIGPMNVEPLKPATAPSAR